MSDALLKEISAKLTDIHGALKGGAAPAASSGGAATTTKTTPPAGNKAAPGTTKTPPKAAGGAPAAAAKAPGGKYTSEQVRDIVKQVATNANLGKQEALTILDEEGGVQNVSSLKPENFDKVYEACQVALQGVAGHAASADEDDPTA